MDHMGNDNSSLEAARMSTNNPTGVDAHKDDKLRDYLWRLNHSSPSEMSELVVEIQAPIWVIRELDRHRSIDYATDTIVETVDEIPRKFMSRNEYSGRYSEYLDAFYIPPLERIKGQAKINKQGSEGEIPLEVKQEFLAHMHDAIEYMRIAYHFALNNGIARELARIIMPLNVYSRLRLKGSLLSWLKFLNLRDRDDVQPETRDYAIAIAEIVKDLFPKSYAVFEEHTMGGIQLSKSEREYLKKYIETGEPGDPETLTLLKIYNRL